MKTNAKILASLSVLALLGGCAALGGKGPKDTPTIGKRIDILGTEADSVADPNLAGVSVILPPAATNANWSQPGGKRMKLRGAPKCRLQPRR